MTQARTCANGLVTPSLPQPWLAALLRMFVELVLNVGSFVQMRARRLPAECHSDVTPTALPEGWTGIIQESKPAATNSQTIEAFMLRDRDAIVSKHEGVLTHIGPRGTPPLGKGRSAFRRSRNPGGDHFVPRPPARKTPTQILTASEPDLPLPGGGETAPA